MISKEKATVNYIYFLEVIVAHMILEWGKITVLSKLNDQNLENLEAEPHCWESKNRGNLFGCTIFLSILDKTYGSILESF